MFDVVIVNYNTTLLTNACIKSLKKSGTNCRISVFDNSDKEPFKSLIDDVNIIDNTKGQIINFDKFLNQFPNKRKTSNNWGSDKHAKTIDTLFDLFPDGFIHLDSDTIVKRNLDELFNPSFALCGIYCKTIDGRPHRKFPRIHPCLMYVNVPMCKKNNIRFFDPKRSFALTQDVIMDNGQSFYQDLQKANLPIKQIDNNKYISHMNAGSYNKSMIDSLIFISNHLKYLL